MLESIPGTYQYLAIRVKFLAQGNNGALDGALTHNLHITRLIDLRYTLRWRRILHVGWFVPTRMKSPPGWNATVRTSAASCTDKTYILQFILLPIYNY